jgi:hypothetical protein
MSFAAADQDKDIYGIKDYGRRKSNNDEKSNKREEESLPVPSPTISSDSSTPKSPRSPMTKSVNFSDSDSGEDNDETPRKPRTNSLSAAALESAGVASQESRKHRGRRPSRSASVKQDAFMEQNDAVSTKSSNRRKSVYENDELTPQDRHYLNKALV